MSKAKFYIGSKFSDDGSNDISDDGSNNDVSDTLYFSSIFYVSDSLLGSLLILPL